MAEDSDNKPLPALLGGSKEARKFVATPVKGSTQPPPAETAQVVLEIAGRSVLELLDIDGIAVQLKEHREMTCTYVPPVIRNVRSIEADITRDQLAHLLKTLPARTIRVFIRGSGPLVNLSQFENVSRIVKEFYTRRAFGRTDTFAIIPNPHQYRPTPGSRGLGPPKVYFDNLPADPYRPKPDINSAE